MLNVVMSLTRSVKYQPMERTSPVATIVCQQTRMPSVDGIKMSIACVPATTANVVITARLRTTILFVNNSHRRSNTTSYFAQNLTPKGVPRNAFKVAVYPYKVATLSSSMKHKSLSEILQSTPWGKFRGLHLLLKTLFWLCIGAIIARCFCGVYAYLTRRFINHIGGQ